ncbi:MAG: NADH-quinone oxidoreductase subunit NuoH [Chloroflexi bacterium]|nr:NADH-quinone oxidoreductase subunit NuoH [Chloroflexota bacterium]
MLTLTYDVGNIWLDSLLGLFAIVGLMTVGALSLIWLERKISARIQMRLGPMHVGPYGLLQTLADAVKLIGKEDMRPRTADRWVFELAPFAVFVPAFVALAALPFTRDWAVSFLDLGLFFIVAVTGLSFVGFLMAGWASDNKYALLGGLRAAAQLISYEVPMVLSLIAVAMIVGSLSLSEIVIFQGRVPLFVWQPLAFFIFLVATLAELERQPFDIPTAESEVVGGPFIEYSGIRWSMFFLASYTSLIVYSVLGALVFLGGWDWPLGRELGLWWQLVLIVAKTGFLVMLFMWIRFAMPRLRIDQLMSYCWKVLIPLAFLQIFLNGLVLVYDWPDIMLLITSGAGLLLAFYIIDRTVRVDPRTVRLVPAGRSAAALPPPAGAESGGS